MVLAVASAFRRRHSAMPVSYARACHSCVWYVQILNRRSCVPGGALALALAAGTCARRCSGADAEGHVGGTTG